MRILINAVSAKAGGGITYLVNLLKYLPVIMASHDFLCVIQDIELPKELYCHKNLEIRKIPQASGNVLKRYWWENTGLIKLGNQWKADVLYCIANMTPLIPTIYKKVLMIQNAAPLTPKALYMLVKYEGLKKFFQMLANTILTLLSAALCKKTIVLSNATKKLLQRYLPFKKTNIIYHGIDTSSFSYKALRPEKAGNKPYYIFVSNLYVYKGLEYIIDAYRANENLPSTFIAGFPFDLMYVNHIKQLITKYNLQEKIQFLDSVPHNELPGWYANALGMVYPSWCENCPNILLEAKACGCPIIAMDIGPMPELCNNQEIIVNPFDGKALAEGMERATYISKTPERIRQLKDFTDSFTWEAAMLKHKECFEEINNG